VGHLLQRLEASAAREGALTQQMQQLQELLAAANAASTSSSSSSAPAAAAAGSASEQQLQQEVALLGAIVAVHEQEVRQEVEESAGIIALRQEMQLAASGMEEQLQQLQDNNSDMREWVEQLQQGGLGLLYHLEDLQEEQAQQAEQVEELQAAQEQQADAATWKAKYERAAVCCHELREQVAATKQQLQQQQQKAARQQMREAEARFDQTVGGLTSVVNQVAASSLPGLGVRFEVKRSDSTGKVLVKGKGANGAVLKGTVHFLVHPSDPNTCTPPQEAVRAAVAKRFEPEKALEVVMALKASMAGGLMFWGLFEVDGAWWAVMEDAGITLRMLLNGHPEVSRLLGACGTII
jgi:hypothetical protein